MTKKSNVVTAILIMLLLNVNSTFATEVKNSALGKCSILFDFFSPYKLKRTYDSTRGSICGVSSGYEYPYLAEADRKRLKLRFLKRSDDNRYVAVVKITPGSPVILNPVIEDEINYGPIPTIENITIEQSDILWGPDQSKNSKQKDKRTYKLVLGHTIKRMSYDPYFLDIVFHNRKIKKYKIRSKEISSPSWIVISNKKTGKEEGD